MKSLSKALCVFVASLTFGLLIVGCGNKNKAAQQSNNKLGLKSPIVIKYSHVQSTNSPTHKAMTWLNDYLKKNSDGMVSMEIYPSGQLYNDKTEIDAIVTGNVDMISTYMSKLTSVDQSAQFALAPYLFSNVDEMEEFYTSEQARPLYNKIEDLGIKVVDVMFGGEQYFMSNGASIAKISGFRGKKVREGGGAMTNALYDSLGASVTTVPFSELYTAMQTKLVDIAVTSVDSAVNIQLQEVLKSVSNYKHQFAPYLIMFNKQKWDSYPPEVQKLLSQGLKEARKQQLEYTEEDCDKALQTIKKTCEFHEATPEEIAELKAKWDPITAKYVSKEWLNAISDFKKNKK